MSFKFNLKTQVLVGFIATGIALIAMSIFSVISSNQMEEASKYASVTQDVVANYDNVQLSFLVAQNSEREFEVSKNEKSLELYFNSKADVSHHFGMLKSIKHADSSQLLFIAKMENLVNNVFSRLDKNVDYIKQKLDSGKNIAFIDNKNTNATVKDEIEKMQKAEEDKLALKLKETKESSAYYAGLSYFLRFAVIVILIFLFISISTALKTIKKTEKESSEKNWTLSASSDFVKNLQGNKTFTELAQTIINNLCSIVNAQNGALYIVNEDGTSLFLAAAYANGTRKRELTISPIPDGLIGQAAFENKIMYITDIPADNYIIDMGSGELKPRNIFVMPFVYEGKVVGVVELGTIYEFNTLQKEYLQIVMDSIAIAFNTSFGKLKLEKLVKDLHNKEREINNQINAINKSNAAVEFDLKGNILTANEIFCILMGYELEEIIGKHHSIFVDPEFVKTKDYKEFWKNLSEGQYIGGEFQRIRKDGGLVWINGNYNPLFDENGKPYKVLKIATDITESKSTAEAELNNQINAINRSNASIEFDLNGYVLKANELICRIMGYGEQEIIGKHHSSFVDETVARSEQYKEFWNNLKNGEFTQGEYAWISKTGFTVWIQGSYNPILDAKGNTYKVLKIASDITQVKKVQLEMKQQFEAINSLAIVSETDLEGNMTYANDIFCDLAQYTREELMGKNHRMLKSGKQPQGIFVGMWAAITKGLTWKGEVLNKKKHGGFYWVDATIVPFKDPTGKIYKYVGIRFDITKQKERQELLSQQAEELKVQQAELEESNVLLEEQSQKLKENEEKLIQQQEELLIANQELEEQSQLLEEKNQAVNEKNGALEKASAELVIKAEELALSSKYKSEFLSNMSHELRTPLNSILLLSNLLSENYEGNLTPDQAEYATVIHNAGNGLLQLINEILDLSKIESGKMELEITEANVADINKGISDIFSHLAKNKGLDFSIVKQPEATQAMKTDRFRLEQVLKNFLSNAFKFTEKGKVTLIERLPNAEEAGILGIEANKFIAFEVKDSGIGIPKDKHKLVFEAFQQADGSTRRKYGGTGLGLSISREISRLLGGEVLLKSEPGEGSSFTMVVPIDSTGIKPLAEAKKNAEFQKAHATLDAFEHSVRKETTVISTKEPEIDMEAEIDPNIVAFTPNEIPDDRFKIRKKDKVILIIEDDTAFAYALVSHIRERGYKVVVAVTGANALDFAIRYKPKGILLDIQLPAKSGWTIIKELKDNPLTKHIPVHMMSSLEIKSKDTIALGAVDFINKASAETEIGNVLDKLEKSSGDAPKTILIVDDNEVHTLAISVFLTNASKTCITAKTAAEAYQQLGKNKIDCVVLDMGLPDANGYEVLENMKNDERYEKIPVIIYTGSSISPEEEQKLKQYAGAIIIKTADSFNRLSSEISMFLHLVEEEKDKKSPEKPYIKDTALNGKHILIVDDDTRNIFSLSRLLEQRQIKVSSSIDGKVALETLKQDKTIDLVLMDMMMPNMDGYETTSLIRKDNELRKIPVIAVTAKAMLGDREKCIEAGANDYVTKPVDGDQLLSLLRVWLYNN